MKNLGRRVEGIAIGANGMNKTMQHEETWCIWRNYKQVIFTAWESESEQNLGGKSRKGRPVQCKGTLETMVLWRWLVCVQADYLYTSFNSEFSDVTSVD